MSCSEGLQLCPLAKLWGMLTKLLTLTLTLFSSYSYFIRSDYFTAKKNKENKDATLSLRTIYPTQAHVSLHDPYSLSAI